MMPWTDEVVDELRRMWAEGLTTSEIAKSLGVSKNSIVGKVHRLGLSGRPSPIKRKVEVTKASSKKKAAVEVEIVEIKEEPKVVAPEVKKEVKKTAPAPAKQTAKEKKAEAKTVEVEEVIEIITPVETHPKSKDGLVRLVDLDGHTCRWPVGDPKDEKFHFCGKKVRLGQTYCEEHSEVAYVRQTKK